MAYPVLAVAFMLTGGKPYYLAAYLPALLAAARSPPWTGLVCAPQVPGWA